MSAVHIALIVAMDRQRAIGKAGALPWHLPADLKHFKALTIGHSILMGRKTFDSIGKPLPGRKNLVLTRQRNWQHPGVHAVTDIDAAIASCSGELWVIGGAEIYALALPLADRVELTEIDTTVAGADTWFPELPAKFCKVQSVAQSDAGYDFRCVSYRCVSEQES
jgi:dihydrofolate reductase